MINNSKKLESKMDNIELLTEYASFLRKKKEEGIAEGDPFLVNTNSLPYAPQTAFLQTNIDVNPLLGFTNFAPTQPT